MQSEANWLMERAKIIRQFKDNKPPLPPPLNVLWYLFYDLPTYLRSFSKGALDVPGPVDGFKVVTTGDDLRQMLKNQHEYLNVCLERRRVRQESSTTAKQNHLEQSIEKLERMTRSQFEQLTGYMDSLTGRFDEVSQEVGRLANAMRTDATAEGAGEPAASSAPRRGTFHASRLESTGRARLDPGGVSYKV